MDERFQGGARDRFFARPSGSDRERLHATFDQVAGLYDRARPRYPVALYDDLIEMTGIEPGERLLEVGCATGIATRPLLKRGYAVVCLEPGRRLAAAARRNLSSLPAEVLCTDFESFNGVTERFALVFAATAWHWVDPNLRYQHAHDLLKPGGHLAFWNALHAFPTGFDPFFEEIGAVYEQIGWPPHDDWPPPTPDQIADDVHEIVATTLFDDVRTRQYVWNHTYTAEQYIALLDTFSSHISLPATEREHLYNWIREHIATRPSKRVHRHWYAILHVARAR
jgi:SAM-dependent methyltransferase